MAFSVSYNFIAKDRFSAVSEKIGRAAKKTAKSIDRIAKSAKKAGKKIRELGKDVSLNLSAPFVIAGGLALKTAADLETLQVSLEVMLKSADKAKEVMASLVSFTARTPFQLEGVAQSGRQLLAASVATENLEARLLTLGDIASGAKVPLGDIASIFTKIKNKNKALTEEIQQLSDRGIPIIQQLAITLNKPESAILDLAQTSQLTFPIMLKAFQDMTTGAGIFAGAMEQQSRTLSGSTSTLRDNIKLITGATGNWFSETIGLTDAIIKLNTKLKPAAVQKWFEEFSEGSPVLSKIAAGTLIFTASIGPMIAGIGQALISLGFMAQGIAALTLAFPVLTARIKASALAALSFGRAMVFAGISVVKFAAKAVVFGVIKAATLAWAAAQWLLNAALTANPIGLIVVGIAAAIAAIVFIIKKVKDFGGLTNVFKKIGQSIINFLLAPYIAVAKVIDLIAGTDLSGKLTSFIQLDALKIEPPAAAGAQDSKTEVEITINAPAGVVGSAAAKSSGQGRTNLGLNMPLAGAS